MMCFVKIFLFIIFFKNKVVAIFLSIFIVYLFFIHIFARNKRTLYKVLKNNLLKYIN